ncbi:hypothetical protein DsansV1_C29g0211891 [Dioscorea sansibarensis]
MGSRQIGTGGVLARSRSDWRRGRRRRSRIQSRIGGDQQSRRRRTRRTKRRLRVRTCRVARESSRDRGEEGDHGGTRRRCQGGVARDAFGTSRSPPTAPSHPSPLMPRCFSFRSVTNAKEKRGLVWWDSGSERYYI